MILYDSPHPEASAEAVLQALRSSWVLVEKPIHLAWRLSHTVKDYFAESSTFEYVNIDTWPRERFRNK